MELTNEQQEALAAAMSWYESGTTTPFVISGYAGTGKTTLLSALISKLKEERRNVQVCAPTGKAASVLGNRLATLGMYGVRPTTLHKAIYDPPYEDNKKLVFSRKESVRADLFLVDEASMVSKNLMADLSSFGVPVLLVGDGYQLPPVGGPSAFLAQKPDVRLVNVVRQAEGNPILQLATTIRNGDKVPTDYFVKTTLGTVGVSYGKKGREWAQAFYSKAGEDNTTILCHRNKTRVAINTRVRGESSTHPIEGDKLVILVNRPDIDLYNGEVHRLTDIVSAYKNPMLGIACFDDNPTAQMLYLGCFNQEHAEICDQPDYKGRWPISADYGYAVTVHKAQGSEWDNVMVIDEYPETKDDYRRWLYTAVTRAKHNLLITK